MGQFPVIFPNETASNKVIVITGISAKEFSCIATNKVPNLHLINTSQCFPLYLYSTNSSDVKSDDSFQIKLFQKRIIR